MTAREKFKVGDRVRMTDAYVARLRNRRWAEHRFGHVIGFCMSPTRVRVRREGFRYSALRWDIEHWDKVDESARPAAPDLDRVARELVTALYLYSGYTVGSRGPAGCIMTALDEVAPDIAREIRDGEEPGDIFQRRWAEP